jgi:hypothetical protein
MRKPDPIEIVAIAIPVLAEAVVMVSFIAMIALWIIIGSTERPA